MELVDGSGFGNLALGDDRDAVRHCFGEHRVFRRTPDAPETDEFPVKGLLVTYGPDLRVSFIELTSPADPTVQNVQLLGQPLDEVGNRLRARRLSLAVDPEGARIEGWSVGLYASSGIVEGVSIGERGA